MKKMLLVMGMILAVTLICGCAGQEENAADEGEGMDPEGMAEAREETDVNPDAGGELAEDENPAQDLAPAEDALSNASAENSSSGVGTLSQADLDRLKADLEKLEFEDVGGLSGE